MYEYRGGDRVRWLETFQEGTVRMCDGQNVWVDWDDPHEYEDKLVELPEGALIKIAPRREALMITHDEFDRMLAMGDPIRDLFHIVETHFYGEESV